MGALKMPGFKSQLISLTMHNRHIFYFKLKPEEWDWNTSIPAFRQPVEAGSSRMKLPDGIQVLPVTIEGLTGVQGRQAEWLIPFDATRETVILYTLGDGYVSGSCKDHRAIVAEINQNSGVSTLMFDHRLAPEDPFPAALEDAVTAYR
jgi:monoterpene epsilon-lactone hydrolase